jgi:hypothetical protein
MKNRKPQNPCSKALGPQTVPAPPMPSLEEMLMRSILNPNPAELNSEIKRIVTAPSPGGVTQLKREGMRVNAMGVTERIKEEVVFIQTLRDGTVINNDSVLVRCQTCRQIVSVESIQRCTCGQTCCISRGCGCYSESHSQWYCSKKHAMLAKFKINLRWIG